MKIFRVSHQGLDDTIVVARDCDQAAELFVTSYYAARVSFPGEFAISPWKGPGDPEQQRPLEEAVQRGVAGILQCHPDLGWVLTPPDA